MSSHAFLVLSLQVALMLAAALFLGWLMRAIRQPPVLGEMMGGILLGPTVLGLLAPAVFAWIFLSAPDATLVRGGIVKLGMLLFLFVVGLEINLADLRKHGLSAILIGGLGTLIPLGAGVALVYATPDLWPAMTPDNRLSYALFVGAALANSANPVLARILMDLGLLKQPVGAVLMTATIVDDLVGWCLLALVLAHFTPAHGAAGAAAGALDGGSLTGILIVLGFFAVILGVGHFLGRPAMRFARRALPFPAGYVAGVSILVLLSAALAEELGIHAFLGPFVVGIALAPRADERNEVEGVLNDFVVSFFVPIYFVSMGLSANFITQWDTALILAVLGVACLSKIGSVYLAARIAGMDGRTALGVGFGMNARGATGIILAAVALENGVIDQRVYVALVVMALVTSLMAGPAMNALIKGRAPAAATDARPARS